MAEQHLCELCGEPIDEGEPFRYHGFSGPCPKPPLRGPKNNVVVHAGVSNNLYPQGPTFHWRDGWMFARGEGMAVHIWKTDDPNPPTIQITIPYGEWESIVGFLSYPAAPPTPKSQGRCETTLTERFEFPELSVCSCGTYAGNLGPCKTFLQGAETGRCVYCDHAFECHAAVGG